MAILPDFPQVIDSTMRSALVACARQFFYGHLLSLRKPGTSIHLHFGGCMASALETTRKAFYGQGLSEIEAVSEGCHALIRQWGDFEPPPGIENTRAGVKTLDAALDALVSYFEYFPLSSDQIQPLIIDGEPMVEKSFALPIPYTMHPTTGEPIVYAGRFDMLGSYNDAVFVVDEKTSTALGATWRSNWPLRGQLTGYSWGARSFGLNVAGVIVRGIGVLKQSIAFEQAVLTRPDWQVEAWLRQLTRDVNRATTMWQRAADRADEQPWLEFDQALDSACSAYGGCGYVNLCDSPDPSRWYSDYVVSPWDPLQRSGDNT